MALGWLSLAWFHQALDSPVNWVAPASRGTRPKDWFGHQAFTGWLQLWPETTLKLGLSCSGSLATQLGPEPRGLTQTATRYRLEPNLSQETKFPSRKREECGPCGQVKRVGCEYVAHLPACAGKRGQRPFLGSSSPNPVSRAGATGWRAQSLDYLSRTPRTLPRESRSYCLAEPWLFLPGDSMSA